MSMMERIFHTLLFEAIALLLFVLLAGVVTQGDSTTLAGLGIGMSLLAMIINFIYNWVFDHLAGADRAVRGLKLRLLHAGLFELSLMAVSLPVLMYVLKMDFWSVLVLDLGMVVFFLVYAFVFNWSYDLIRQRVRPDSPATLGEC